MLPGGVAVNSVQFEMEWWTGAQRAFAVKSFYKNDSYVAAQREFRKKFGIHRNSKVQSAHAIKTLKRLAQLLRRKVVLLKLLKLIGLLSVSSVMEGILRL